MKTIKIFLGSSLDELYNERRLLGDYIMNSVRPIFKYDDVDVELLKCEDMDLGFTGEPSQNIINDQLNDCSYFIFVFKKKAGGQTRLEYDIARAIQKAGTHHNTTIRVYILSGPDEGKEQELLDFQEQLKKDGLYWSTFNNPEDIRGKIEHHLIQFERQLLGKTKPSTIEQESKAEIDADALFADFMQDEEKQTQRKEKIHQNIEDISQQTKTVMANEDETIAARIFKVIELYKKADQWAAATDYDKEKYSDLMFDYAKFLYDYGLYFDAEAIYLRQIKYAEELYGKKYEKIISSYNELGKVYRELAQHSKALEYYFKVLQFAENAQEKACNMLAITYRNIGLVYFDCGKYSKAMKYYLKALEIQQKIYGDNHIETASSYNNIGSVYRELGKNSIAIEYYNKALEIRNNNLNENSPLIANTYNNLGCAYYNLGEYVKAETYHLKALEIREKSLGTDHPYTGQTYNNLGTVYWSQKNYTKALTYFQNGLKVQEKTLGKSNPFIAIDYNNIGMVFREQSDYHSALDNFKKALEIEECIHRLEHPYTAVIYHNIGITYYYLQKYQQSLECLEKASIIRIKNPSSYYQHLQNTPEWISKVQNAIEENKTSDEPLRQNKTIENEYI